MRLVYCLILAFLSFPCFGAELEWSSRLEGNELVTPGISTLKIRDGDYGNLQSGLFSDINSFSYVRLGLNERIITDFTTTSGVTKRLQPT